MDVEDFDLNFPAFDLRNDLEHQYCFSSDYKSVLFSSNRQLLIGKKELIVMKGTLVSKKFTFEENIVTATYSFFNGNKNQQEEKDTLVVCFENVAHMYFQNGKKHSVTFPFKLKKAFPFESGLILEKELNKLYLSNYDVFKTNQISGSKFLTLVDTLGDFRSITTSSTSVISHYEEMMTFPKKNNHKSLLLCATYNSIENVIIIYFVRTSSSQKKTSSSVPKKNHRNKKKFLLSTPNNLRSMEDDLSLEMNKNVSFNQNHLSLNMDKKRACTFLTDALLNARVENDVLFQDLKNRCNRYCDYPNYRKDMILSKLDVINISVEKSQLKIHNLYFEDQTAIIIFNKVKKEAYVHIFKYVNNNHYQSYFKYKCDDCIPLDHSKYEGILISLKNNHYLHLVNPFLEIVSPKIDLKSSFPKIVSLTSSCEENLAFISDTNKIYYIKLVLEPKCDLVAKCLKCFEYSSGSKIKELIWMVWRSSLMLDDLKDEWNAFVITLLSLIYPFNENSYESNEITDLLEKAKHIHETSLINYAIFDLISYIVIFLHLLREEYRLNIVEGNAVQKLGVLLTQLTVWMGWPEEWIKYYMISFDKIDRKVRFLLILILEKPPNILESLSSLFDEKVIAYITISQLLKESESLDILLTPRTVHVLKIFQLIINSNYNPKMIIETMCDFGITQNELKTYPCGIYLPLMDAILVCQENPNFEWSTKALELVERKDLDLFLSNKTFNPVIYDNDVKLSSIDEILDNIFNINDVISPWDDQLEADRLAINTLIFDYDRRYHEITSLLHQNKTQMAVLINDENVKEYDLTIMQRNLAALVALRTLTIPMGRASLFYASRKPLLTEKFPIPSFNFSVLILPTMTNIILSQDAISHEIFEWGHFHNGVSAGLTINKNSKNISSSWIIFNKPRELNAEHAGFILGLGLNGHLNKLEEWHIYNYLGPKHSLTSISLLIGMAASIKGSMDNKLTKVLSVHSVALLPLGANDLNVSIPIQTAGLIGIGLLYLETQHRRMSEILLDQISNTICQNDIDQIDEGYRLAAGIALGFVNLGKGEDLRGLNDTHVVDKLILIATIMKDFQQSDELNKSSSGAILALGFVYLKTENTSIANKLKIPDAEQLLDYIRPDLQFLRCLSKNIIMWNSIDKTVDWVKSEIPEFLVERYINNDINVLDSDQIGFYNILGGLCLTIGLRFASTHDIVARDTLLHFSDKMMKIISKKSSTYDQKVAYHTANNIQKLIALSVSLVMAGSGDLKSFRILRVMYNDTSRDLSFGNFMIINTALGFLFLGGGQYAFSDSNFAIASMIVSFYPLYPSENSDHDIHLQALRHLWALSVEPRCLIVRDVITQNPIKIKATLTLKDGSKKLISPPCLLPNLETISSIETLSDEFFKSVIHFDKNSRFLSIFKQNLTIYVYRKKNYMLLNSSLGSLLKIENSSLMNSKPIDPDTKSLFNLDIFASISKYEKSILLNELAENTKFNCSNSEISIFNMIENKLNLELITNNIRTVDDVWNLKIIFGFAEKFREIGLNFLPLDFIEKIRQKILNLF